LRAWLASLWSSLRKAGAGAPTAGLTDEVRLRAVAVRLEAILDELDVLGAQRIAIDVCMALERVRARLNADARTEALPNHGMDAPTDV
jgi:hypothetical protein